MDRFCLGDNTITFSDDFAKLNELRKGISCISRYAKIGTYIAQRMQETGQKPNVDRIAQGFTSQMNEAIEGGTIPVAIDFLVNNGIYDCSEELFIRKYKDQYFDIENSTGYKKFIQKYNAVTDAYVMENAQKHLKRASRSRWEGGGFGIRGAIKGAVDASILNAATDTFRGIGDGISDFAGSVHYKNQKEALINEDLFQCLDDAMYEGNMGVLFACENEYQKHTGVKCTWDYEENNSQANALFQNVKSRITDPQKKLQIMATAIQLAPYNEEFYLYLYKTEKENRKEIAELANYLGFFLYDLRAELLQEELQQVACRYPLTGRKKITSAETILTHRKYIEGVLNLGLKYSFFDDINPVIISAEKELDPESFELGKLLLSKAFSLSVSVIDEEAETKICEKKYTEATHQQYLLELEAIKKRFNIDSYEIPKSNSITKVLDFFEYNRDLELVRRVNRENNVENALQNIVDVALGTDSADKTEQIYALSLKYEVKFNQEFDIIDGDIEIAHAILIGMAWTKIKKHKEEIEKLILKPNESVRDINLDIRKTLCYYRALPTIESLEINRDFYPKIHYVANRRVSYSLFEDCQEWLNVTNEIIHYFDSRKSTSIERETTAIGAIVLKMCQDKPVVKGEYVNLAMEKNFAKGATYTNNKGSSNLRNTKLMIPRIETIYMYYEKNAFLEKNYTVLTNRGIHTFCTSLESTKFYEWRQIENVTYAEYGVKLKLKGKKYPQNIAFCWDDNDDIYYASKSLEDCVKKIKQYEYRKAESIEYYSSHPKTFIGQRISHFLSPNEKERVYLLDNPGDQTELSCLLELMRRTDFIIQHELNPTVNLFIKFETNKLSDTTDLQQYKFIAVTDRFIYGKENGALCAIAITDINKIEKSYTSIIISWDDYVSEISSPDWSNTEISEFFEHLSQALVISVDTKEQPVNKSVQSESTPPRDTLFCPYCGKKITRSSKFCCFCGSKINYKK